MSGASEQDWQWFLERVSYVFFALLVNHIGAQGKLDIAEQHRRKLLEIFNWQQQELDLCKHFTPTMVVKTITQLTAAAEPSHHRFVPPTAGLAKSSQHTTKSNDMQISANAWTALTAVIFMMCIFGLVIFVSK